MTNYDEKEEKALDSIVNSIGKLDDTLAKIDNLENTDTKKHSVKKWYEEKKAIHEIKHILHKIGKYDAYDDKELEKFEAEYSDILNSLN